MPERSILEVGFVSTDVATKVTTPFPETPTDGPTDLFLETINDHPTVQYLSDLPTENYGDHFAVRLCNFRELTMSHVSVNAGEHHPSHFHKEGPHAIFVVAGQGVLRVGDIEYPVRPGAFAVIAPMVPHYTRNTGTTPLDYVQLMTPRREDLGR